MPLCVWPSVHPAHDSKNFSSSSRGTLPCLVTVNVVVVTAAAFFFGDGFFTTLATLALLVFTGLVRVATIQLVHSLCARATLCACVGE